MEQRLQELQALQQEYHEQQDIHKEQYHSDEQGGLQQHLELELLQDHPQEQSIKLPKHREYDGSENHQESFQGYHHLNGLKAYRDRNYSFERDWETDSFGNDTLEMMNDEAVGTCQRVSEDDEEETEEELENKLADLKMELQKSIVQEIKPECFRVIMN